MDKLIEKSKHFRIGERTYEFNYQDSIFYASGPERNHKHKKFCPVDFYQFKSRAEMLFCDFCGQSVCQNCRKKKRLFPLGPVDEETGRLCLPGEICKVCDRKFFIRDNVKKSLDQMKAVDKSIVTMADNLGEL